jgi:hypothetical protein
MYKEGDMGHLCFIPPDSLNKLLDLPFRKGSINVLRIHAFIQSTNLREKPNLRNTTYRI